MKPTEPHEFQCQRGCGHWMVVDVSEDDALRLPCADPDCEMGARTPVLRYATPASFAGVSFRQPVDPAFKPTEITTLRRRLAEVVVRDDRTGASAAVSMWGWRREP